MEIDFKTLYTTLTSVNSAENNIMYHYWTFKTLKVQE